MRCIVTSFLMKTQLKLPILDKSSTTYEFGGSLRDGHRKTRRPFSSKKPLHLVIRKSHLANFPLNSKANRPVVERVLARQACRWAIKIYEQAIGSTHVHIVCRARNRSSFQGFLRSATGRIAALLTGAARGKPFGKFWANTTFSRVLEWGRAFLTACRYVVQNALEAAGAIPYRPRTHKSERSEGSHRRSCISSTSPPDRMR